VTFEDEFYHSFQNKKASRLCQEMFCIWKKLQDFLDMLAKAQPQPDFQWTLAKKRKSIISNLSNFEWANIMIFWLGWFCLKTMPRTASQLLIFETYFKKE
jgi:hypothetical protein